MCGASGAARNRTRPSTTPRYLLPDPEAVIGTDEDVPDVVHLDSLFEFWFHREFELLNPVPVPPVDGTAGLVSLENISVADVDAPVLCVGAEVAVHVRSVIGLQNVLRGLDDEMVVAVLQVDDDSRGNLFRFDGLLLLHVLLRGLDSGDVSTAGDVKSGLSCGVGSDSLPILSVVLPNEPPVITIQMAHFVEDSVAEHIHRHIVVGGNLHADTTSVSPIELTELTAVVRYLDGDGREFVVENLLVELIEPSLNVCESGCHILFLLITIQR